MDLPRGLLVAWTLSLWPGTAGVERPSEETLTWDNGTGKAKVKLAEERVLPQEEAMF